MWRMYVLWHDSQYVSDKLRSESPKNSITHDVHICRKCIYYYLLFTCVDTVNMFLRWTKSARLLLFDRKPFFFLFFCMQCIQPRIIFLIGFRLIHELCFEICFTFSYLVLSIEWIFRVHVRHAISGLSLHIHNTICMRIRGVRGVPSRALSQIASQ